VSTAEGFRPDERPAAREEEGTPSAVEACPLCGRPPLTSDAKEKCSPLSDCPAWTTQAVFDHATPTWLPVDPDGFALDGRDIKP
jgi:hypothetical protein